jgi:hypothetical protein
MSSPRNITYPLLLLASLTACGDAERAAVVASAAPARMAEAGVAPMEMAATAASETAQVRYLAERQHWVMELPEKQIEARWQAHVDLCRAGCEVLQAAIAKSTQTPISASLQLRVARAAAPALLQAMHSPEVKERRIEREDKTLQVVDVEARLKNLGELRDRLRKLLESRPGALKEVLETERELARVQGDLDAMAAQRKALANETEKILLNVDYRPEATLTQTGALQPLAEVFGNAGRALAESLAEALLFVIRVLPWLFIVLPFVWGGWKLVKRLFDWRRGAGKA